jgi:hypothetical protein
MPREELSNDPWRPAAPIWDGTWDRLAGPVYAGARDGNLRPEAAFDMACFLMEWAQPDPAFGDLAEASVDGSDPDGMADLARRALAIVAFVPDFALEPRLLMTLEQALAFVAADLRATGLDGQARLVILEGGEPSHAYVQYDNSFGHTSGLAPRDGDESNRAETLALVADELQDAVMESLCGAWPVCPRHQLGAHPRTVDNQAVWWCKGGSGHDICFIGRWAPDVLRKTAPPVP